MNAFRQLTAVLQTRHQPGRLGAQLLLLRWVEQGHDDKEIVGRFAE